jgi:hypothetical protein
VQIYWGYWLGEVGARAGDGEEARARARRRQWGRPPRGQAIAAPGSGQVSDYRGFAAACLRFRDVPNDSQRNGNSSGWHRVRFLVVANFRSGLKEFPLYASPALGLGL